MRLLSLTTTLFEIRDPLFRRPFARWCAIAAATFLAGAWLSVAAIPNIPGDEAIVVHYTTTFGIDALGRWTDLLLRFPIVGTVILIVNLGVARFLISPSGEEDPIINQDSSVVPPKVGGEKFWQASIAPAPFFLLAATAFLEFAVLVGTILIFRINRNW